MLMVCSLPFVPAFESEQSYMIGYLIWRLSLKGQASTSRALAPFGITATQYSVLASLYGLSTSIDKPTQRELADWSGLEPMHVSMVVRALERAGLVKRSMSSTDTRALELALTERGREIAAAAVETVRQHEERRLAPLGDRKSLQLSRLLRELLASMEALDKQDG
jgi:DNA-binding MarR family transcriptional regulator